MSDDVLLMPQVAWLLVMMLGGVLLQSSLVSWKVEVVWMGGGGCAPLTADVDASVSFCSPSALRGSRRGGCFSTGTSLVKSESEDEE